MTASLMLTSECSDARIVQLVSTLIALQSISDSVLQQQLIAELRQVSRVVVLQDCCFLLKLIGLLQHQTVATTLQQHTILHVK